MLAGSPKLGLMQLTGNVALKILNALSSPKLPRFSSNSQICVLFNYKTHKKTRRQEDKKTRRPEDKKTGRQENKKTRRQEDRKTKRQAAKRVG